MTSTPAPPHAPARESAAPVPDDRPADVVADVVVVGGGGGGLPTALFSRWLGNEVVLLEKADVLGGTARKAAFWYWVPANEPMRAAGIADEEPDFLRYVARLARPTAYDPESPTLGLSPWEYDMCRAIYASASPAAELLAERGALEYRHCAGVPDYWSELPEDKAPTGRVLVPAGARESMSDGGLVAVASMSAAASRDGVDVRTGHRVQRLVTRDGAVVGVEATTADGRTSRVAARKAVVFATGGFTHDVDLRRNFLHAPVYGGCAASTNEGDFLAIAGPVGAQLRNMNYAWMCPIPLEKAVARDPGMSGMFSVAGDSMVFVDKTGRRVVNEKLQYNELAQRFFAYDGDRGEYPHLVLVQVWDQRSQDHSASDEYGRLIVPPGTDDAHVIRGETLEELSAAIARRLERYRGVTGGLTLAPDFAATLRQTIERFNGFAERGVDEDFHRGEKPVQLLFNGVVKDEPGRTNPTMWPISDRGPYYAALVTGGTLDTKGGPRTNPDGQVLDDTGTPVPGLYGVGNCVASASAQAYWAGGATLGPIIAFAHRAAQAADREPVREPAAAPSSQLTPA
ncbi:FAD binding domain-containing protein [Geodermatophilus tzadiensis]|uniref:FAD binding domain-containing protein n=1 Tax=Geodermatophilus tzadiensis TaxID=1137988 RepID=A0A2T0TSU5_9ACTN|nr:FAD-dependent oxidoreductase [Geodermatophilus tzadiensis]PRY48735.1 FAD binding domain-containing protein [Geodermatophilus tzadiensis]